jgi:ankyrin repeat protein
MEPDMRVLKTLSLLTILLLSLGTQAAQAPHPDLIQSAQRGDVARVHALLQSGVDASLRDAQGYDALDYSVEWAQPKVAHALLRHALDRATHTPEQRRYAEQVLAGEKADTPQQPAPALNTALMRLAAQDGNLPAVRYLLAQGIPADTGADSGYTALALAVRWRHVAVLDALVQGGADVNQATTTCYRTTPLMEATRHGDLTIARRLLDAGARVNTGDRYGDHALNWATYFGQTDQVKLLVERGADLSRTGQTDDTPIEIAYREGHSAIVAFLTAKGARGRAGKPGVPSGAPSLPKP